MEMRELPLREKITISQKRQAAKSQSSQKSSGAWILVSNLHPKYRISEILGPSQVPTMDAEAQYTALYTFIISVIALSSGKLADSRLARYLDRANIGEITRFSNLASGGGIFDKTEKLLRRMEKDGYIIKVRDTSSGEEVIEWVIGPRGKVEVGQQGVDGMVRTVFGDDEDQEDFRRRLQRSLAHMKVVEARQDRPRQKPNRPQRTDADEGDPEDDEDADSS